MPDNGNKLLALDLERLVPRLREALEVMAAQDSPKDLGERRAFLRGVLKAVELVQFAEEADHFEDWYAERVSPHPVEDIQFSDGDGDVVPQPVGAPRAGRSTDVLFLAPPSP